MPARHEVIRRLEALSDRAWPAAEVLRHDGWELRATGPGIGRRVNSAAPVADGSLPLGEKLAFCTAFYRERGLAPTIKLTAASRPAGLDGILAGAGWRPEVPVLVCTAPLPAPPPAGAAGLADHPSPAWLEANAAGGGHSRAAPGTFLGLVGRIRPPVAFASVEEGGEVGAVGMAVADAASVWLLEVATRPELRRRGLAREAVRALLEWGHARGATRAHLQVVAGNAPALALYEQLGFAEAYRYWYRVAP